MEDKKIGARALHYPGLILILKKKFFHQLLPTKWSHAQPEGEKKDHFPENFLAPYPFKK